MNITCVVLSLFPLNNYTANIHVVNINIFSDDVRVSVCLSEK